MSRVRCRDAVKRRYSIAVKGNYSSGTKTLKEKIPARGFPFYNLKFFCKEDKDLVRGSLRGREKEGQSAGKGSKCLDAGARSFVKGSRQRSSSYGYLPLLTLRRWSERHGSQLKTDMMRVGGTSRGMESVGERRRREG